MLFAFAPLSSLAKRLKSLHFAQRTLPLVHGQEITTQSFTAFPGPQNIHTKISPLWKFSNGSLSTR
jgi:hypothetical protein